MSHAGCIVSMMNIHVASNKDVRIKISCQCDKFEMEH